MFTFFHKLKDAYNDWRTEPTRPGTTLSMEEPNGLSFPDAPRVPTLSPLLKDWKKLALDLEKDLQDARLQITKLTSQIETIQKDVIASGYKALEDDRKATLVQIKDLTDKMAEFEAAAVAASARADAAEAHNAELSLELAKLQKARDDAMEKVVQMGHNLMHLATKMEINQHTIHVQQKRLRLLREVLALPIGVNFQSSPNPDEAAQTAEVGQPDPDQKSAQTYPTERSQAVPPRSPSPAKNPLREPSPAAECASAFQNPPPAAPAPTPDPAPELSPADYSFQSTDQLRSESSTRHSSD